MAPFKFFYGVQEATLVTIVDGPNDQDHTNVADIKCGCIRMIAHVNSPDYSGRAARANMWKSKGIYPIITMLDHNIDSFSQATVTAHATAFCKPFPAGFKNVVDVVEFVNEPIIPKAQQTATNHTPDTFWNKLEAVADIFDAAGIGIIVGGNSGTTSGQHGFELWDKGTAAQWNRVMGVGYHPYGTPPSSCLNQVQQVRDRLDGVTGSLPAAAHGLPIYVTEFGWGTNHKEPNQQAINLLCPGATPAAREDVQRDRLQTAFGLFRDNHQALKLRAACWYLWSDSTAKPTPGTFDYCGIRTDVDPGAGGQNPRPPGTNNAPPWRYKSGGGQNGNVGIKAVLDSFGKGEDLGTGPPPTPPTVNTNAIVTGITQTTADISGTVNANGLATTYQFFWGLTSSSMTNARPATPGSAGSGTTDQPKSFHLTGLPSGTTIYWTLRATNNDGTVAGQIRNFPTTGGGGGGEVPEVTTGSATSVTKIGATLSGIVNGQSLPTKWWFEYGTVELSLDHLTPERDLP